MPYQNCGRCAACRWGRANACRDNQTLGVQRDGAARQWINLPAAKCLTRSGLGLREMALVEPQSIGVHAVNRGRIAAGDVVAVLGSGGVGLGAIAASARRGARVIAVDVDDHKLELARRAGAAEIVNASRQEPGSALAELSGGDGPGVVIEAAGQAETYRLAVEAVAFAGRVVCLGYAGAEVPLPTRLFVLKELDIVGSRNATAADFEEAAGAIAEGRLPREALETRDVPLAEAGAALTAWSASAAGGPKIHLDFGL
jgi:threonine dehydrogenase-like Zn-dependent dehydrogenase